MDTVRVRFAPSPTGNLHVGSARTAIFNWLFARHHRGVFILRIEDTDRDRSLPAYTQAILDGLRWLGVDWDEGPEIGGPRGPYFQSERLPLYRQALDRLRTEDRVYPCFCSPERLESVRQAQLQAKENPRYDGHCRHLSPGRAAERAARGEPHALRIRTAAGEDAAWTDLSKGEIRFGAEVLDDIVVAKSDGFPTYNFAVVVDDCHMEISHVIRGEDHISNTPKQIQIYRALGQPQPRFAHIPMILGSDRSKMSKRHGSTNVVEYERSGFLHEAFFNFMALLGWSPPDADRELFSRDELVDRFDLDRVAAHNAIFNLEKLTWMNATYIRALSAGELFQRARPFLAAIPGFPGPYDEDGLTGLVGLFHERLPLLAELTEAAGYFFSDITEYEPKGLQNARKTPDLEAVCRDLADALAACRPFDVATIETVIRAEAERRGLGAAKLIHPVRLAVSGRTTGPGLFELLAAVGQERCVNRLRQFAERQPWVE